MSDNGDFDNFEDIILGENEAMRELDALPLPEESNYSPLCKLFLAAFAMTAGTFGLCIGGHLDFKEHSDHRRVGGIKCKENSDKNYISKTKKHDTKKISDYLEPKEINKMALCSKTDNKNWQCILDYPAKEFTQYLAKELPDLSLSKTIRQYNFVFEFPTSCEKQCALKFTSSVDRKDYEIDYFLKETGKLKKEKDPAKAVEWVMGFDNDWRHIPEDSEVKFYIFPSKQEIQIFIKAPNEKEFSLARVLSYVKIQFCVTSDKGDSQNAKICTDKNIQSILNQ